MIYNSPLEIYDAHVNIRMFIYMFQMNLAAIIFVIKIVSDLALIANACKIHVHVQFSINTTGILYICESDRKYNGILRDKCHVCKRNIEH